MPSTTDIETLQRALGRIDDLEADRARLFQRALGAEAQLEATQKIIDAEKARADGWRMRWEAAQEQITRWFKASGEVAHLEELCRHSYHALHDGFFGGEWAHIVRSQPEICWAAAKEEAEANELLPKLHKIVAAWTPPSNKSVP